MKKRLLLLSIVIVLILCEMWFRVSYIQEQDRLRLKYEGRSLCLESDEALIYTAIPGRCGANSQGYFDAEHSFVKPKDVFRIVIIGDSIAQGQGVGREESFGRVLEKKLNAVQNKKKVEVIILALTGYSTSQELILLREQAFRYDPDMILWSYVLNDPAHPFFHDANGELGRYFYKPRSYLLHYVSARFFNARERMRWKALHSEGMEFHVFLNTVYWDEVKADLGAIGKVSKKKKIPVLFVIHPVFKKDGMFDRYPLTAVHEKLKEYVLLQGLRPLDLLETYQGYRSEQLNLSSEDPWHPNAKGHEVAAEAISEAVLKGDYIK